MGFGSGLWARENSVVISILGSGSLFEWRLEGPSISRCMVAAPKVQVSQPQGCYFLRRLQCFYKDAPCLAGRVLVKALTFARHVTLWRDCLDNATVITVSNALYLHNGPFSHQFSSPCIHVNY
jgi:hypothetical protein